MDISLQPSMNDNGQFRKWSACYWVTGVLIVCINLMYFLPNSLPKLFSKQTSQWKKGC